MYVYVSECVYVLMYFYWCMWPKHTRNQGLVSWRLTTVK